MNDQNRGEGLGANVCVQSESVFLVFLAFILLCVCVHTGFGKGFFSPSPGVHNLSSYSQLSQHAFQQYQLSGIPEGHSLQSDSGLMTGGTSWDMDNMAHSVGSYSGPSHQQGCSQMGMTVAERNNKLHRLALVGLADVSCNGARLQG